MLDSCIVSRMTSCHWLNEVSDDVESSNRLGILTGIDIVPTVILIIPDTHSRGQIHAWSFVSYVTPGCIAYRHMALRVSDIPTCHSEPKDTVVDPKGYRPLVPRDYVYSRSSGAPTRSVRWSTVVVTMSEASSVVEYRISTVDVSWLTTISPVQLLVTESSWL